ncbi:MAG: class I SAM-dependent methyltransferase [Solirubrobacteraceae bacterium]
MAGPRRWDLSDEELRRVSAARSGGIGGRAAVALLARNPRLAAELVRVAGSAVRTGVFGNNSLSSLLGAERARRAVPDAATGVGWYDERPFLAALTPWLRDGSVVLELGCGAGRISRHVAPLVAELVCTDISPTMVAEARENLAAHANVRAQLTDGYALPEFDDERFHVAYGQGVLGYMAPNQLLALLDEVRRVLRPGGVSVFNFFTIDRPEDARHHLEVVLAQARRRRPHGGIDEAYTRAQLEAMHATVGLEVVTSADGDGGKPAMDRIVLVGRRSQPG